MSDAPNEDEYPYFPPVPAGRSQKQHVEEQNNEEHDDEGSDAYDVMDIAESDYGVTSYDIDAVNAKLRGSGMRLDADTFPSVFYSSLFPAIKHFSSYNIPYQKMGYLEEVGDILYQCTKLLCARNALMTDLQKSCLSRVYPVQIRRFNDAQPDEKVFPVPINDLYGMAAELLGDSYLNIVELFRSNGLYCFSNPSGLMQSFAACMAVSHLVRQIRDFSNPLGRYDGMSIDYIIKSKLPEETAELVNVLSYADRKRLSGDELMQAMHNTLAISEKLVSDVDQVITLNSRPPITGSYSSNIQNLALAETLAGILHIGNSDLMLDHALDFTLFKIKGRHELCLQNKSERDLKIATKSPEYIMEAYAVVQGKFPYNGDAA